MASVYHPGELSVQERAGVREMAARIGRSIGSTIPPAAWNFLRSQPLVVVGSVDASQRVWASLLTGAPGFVQAVDEHTVRINARPAAGDPLGDNLAANSQVGLIAIEFATRRRMRLNGKAEVGKDGAITVHAQQVYSNCPKYIQARRWRGRPPEADSTPVVQRQSTPGSRPTAMDSRSRHVLHRQPSSGGWRRCVASRRASRIRARVEFDHRLVWPDYSGNTMFQTLGNIAVNPQAGLLFIDFERGRTLQLTGRARILWDQERTAEFAGAERLVEFDVDEVVEISWSALAGVAILGLLA